MKEIILMHAFAFESDDVEIAFNKVGKPNIFKLFNVFARENNVCTCSIIIQLLLRQLRC